MADVDVASLGLTVDATQVAAAQRILQQFSQSGNQATATAVNFNAATGQFNQGITGTVAQFGRAQAAMASWGALTQQGTVATNQLATATRTAGQAVAISAQQWQFLGFQLNDILTGLASGQSPFTILAQQGGQVYQSLAGPQGVAASLREIGRYALSLVTPFRLLGIGLAVGFVEAAIALGRYNGIQREANITLEGLGRNVGVTTQRFMELSREWSQSARLSVAQTAELATVFARTGRLGVENIGRLTSITKNFATTMGVSVKEAGEELAKAFSTPRGILQLNDQFAFMSARVKGLVIDLFAQGKAQEAITLAQQHFAPALANSESNTTKLVSAWDRLKQSISNADLALGSFLFKTTSTDPVTRLKQIEVQMDNIRNKGTPEERPAAPGGPVFIPSTLRPRPGTVGATLTQQPVAAPDVKRGESLFDKYEGLEFEASANAGKASAFGRQLQEREVALNRLNDQLQESINITVKGSAEYRQYDNALKLVDEARRTSNQRLSEQLINVKDLNEFEQITTHQQESSTDSLRNRITVQDQAITQGGIVLEQQRNMTREGQAELAVRETRNRNVARGITGVQAEVEEETARQRVLQAATIAIQEQNLAMDREAALFGKVGNEREIATQLLQVELQYRRAQQTLSQEELNSFARRIARQTDLNNVQRQLDTIYNNSIKPAEDYQNTIRAGNALLALGKINVNQYALAIDEARIKMLQSQQTMAGGLQAGLLTVAKDFGNVSKGMETMVTSAATTISSSLTDIVVGTKSAKEGFRDMAGSILRNIIEMTIRMTVMAPIARGLTGLLGGGIGSFFGGGTGGVGSVGAELLGGGEFLGAKFAGGFASGGSIGSGKWGIVGERGPEIVKGPADVIPSSTGTSIHYAPVLDMRGASGITEGQVQNLLAQHFVVVKQTLPGLINDARTRRRI